jgi:hypothetical protein
LDGEILGGLHQVDIFKNNKLQLVCNTATRLYVIDRNGNDVQPFPVKLPANATAAMACMDYGNNRDYRLLVPCGRQLLNFGLDGKQIKGWEFGKAKSNLITQPVHKAIGGKDYIVVADAQGQIYLVDRRGLARGRFKSRMAGLNSALFIKGSTPADAYVLSLGLSGYQRHLFFNDNLDSVQAFGRKPDYAVGIKDAVLFGADDALYLTGKGDVVEVALQGNLAEEPGIYALGGKLYMLACTGEDVWVYHENGEPMPGMPLYGSSNAAVGTFSGNAIFSVIALPDGSVVAYKLTGE